MDIEGIRRKNLGQLIKEKYKSQIDFVRETGVNQGETSGLLNGKRVFGERKARKLEKLAGLPAGWLDQNHSQTDDSGDGSPSYADYAPIPIISAKASCGNGYINDNVEILGNFALPRSMLKKIGVSPANAEIIFAYSWSMYPTIRNGSHVLLNKADTEPKEGKIFAICLNDSLVLKRLFMQNGAWFMRSDNPDKNEFPDRPLPAEELTQIRGRVAWFDNIA